MLCSALHKGAAQQVAAPQGLTVSYRKYVNRIELLWKPSGASCQYIVQRREAAAKIFFSIDTVAQNRYVDRKNLRVETDYYYRVMSLESDGRVSAPGQEVRGALMGIADDRKSLRDTVFLKDCLSFRVLEGKITQQFIALTFTAASSCAIIKQADLMLYHSADAVLDDTDALLTQQKFLLSRTRGAVTTPNTGKIPASGYLILRAAAGNGNNAIEVTWQIR